MGEFGSWFNRVGKPTKLDTTYHDKYENFLARICNAIPIATPNTWVLDLFGWKESSEELSTSPLNPHDLYTFLYHRQPSPAIKVR